MIDITLKEDKITRYYDYVLSNVEDFNDLMKIIYVPIIGRYKIGLTLTDINEIKSILYNSERYSHIDIYITLNEVVYKKLILAVPTLVSDAKPSILEYLKQGISKRNLIIKENVVYVIYQSVGKSYEEVDDILDLLVRVFGPFVEITKDGLSRHIVINNIVYPRSVLVNYINLTRYRKSLLERCLKDISPDIVIASMVKQVKKLHEDKCKYLASGLGTDFIKNLNTRNLNMMYYHLVVNKPYHLNDISVILEIYERGIEVNDLL